METENKKVTDPAPTLVNDDSDNDWLDSDSDDVTDWSRPDPDIEVQYHGSTDWLKYHTIEGISNYDLVSRMKIDHTGYHNLLTMVSRIASNELPNAAKAVANLTHYPVVIKKWPPSMTHLTLKMTAVVEPVPELPDGCIVYSDMKPTE